MKNMQTCNHFLLLLHVLSSEVCCEHALAVACNPAMLSSHSFMLAAASVSFALAMCTFSSMAASLQGFDHHTRYEHNMWDYIYLCLELDRIDSSDQNAIQQYVSQQVRFSCLFITILGGSEEVVLWLFSFLSCSD